MSDSEELDEIDDLDEKKKSKQGWGLGFKKWMSSKTAGTTLGRKVISAFLGDEGNTVLNTMKAAARKDVGKSEARWHKTMIMKLAIKGKLLQDERLITKENVWLAAEPMNHLAIKLYDALKPAKREKTDIDDLERKGNSSAGQGNVAAVIPGGGRTSRNRRGSLNLRRAARESKESDVDVVTQLVDEFAKIRDMAVAIIGPHIQEKNIKNMKKVFNYFGGPTFLDKLINDPDYEEQKVIACSSLRTIVQPLLDERNFDEDMRELCQIDDCGFYVVDPTPSFAGSRFCVVHHDEEYKRLTSSPRVDHFLTGDGKHYHPFQLSVKRDVFRYGRKLWVTIQAYKKSKPGIQRVFAEQIYKKWINGDHKVPLDSPSAVSIANELKTRNPNIFDEIEAELYSKLKDYFENQFVNSPEFARYMTSYALPEFLKHQIDKQIKEAKERENQDP